jgi:two-component system, cell cycle sensor histidine kinase and response regulator CckA
MTDVPPTAAPSRPGAEADVPPGPTILVVDDEAGVRVMIARMLSLAGYQVVSAQSGEEALEIAKDYAAPLELVLTDVRMPGMSGPELVEELVKARPGIRVMYMSAYSRDVLPAGARDTDIPFLTKPFTMRTLALSIQETLRRT